MKSRDYIFLSIARNKKRKFFLDEILYCKADNTYTTVKLLNEESYIISMPLKSFDPLLCPNYFCKISRSVILNLHHVLELEIGCDPIITLINNEKLVPDKSKIKQIEIKLYASQAETPPPTS
jgi:two-component system LytT family response regulator